MEIRRLSVSHIGNERDSRELRFKTVEIRRLVAGKLRVFNGGCDGSEFGVGGSVFGGGCDVDG